MLVAIVGRTNVGKSTLFNRLTEKRRALISKTVGTTRDRNYAECLWRGEKITLVDTGGLDVNRRGIIEENIKKQAEYAIEQVNLILLVVDIQTGPLPQDKELARVLRKGKKPIILVANKADNRKFREGEHDQGWLKLGLGRPWLVSANNGTGTGDLLDEIFNQLAKVKIKKRKLPVACLPVGMAGYQLPIITKIAIAGRPNVGKSSLLNAILGEERVIVSPIPHTTREPQDILFTYEEQPLLLIDTAGIRRKARISPGLEKRGVEMSIARIRKSDIALLVIEIQEPVTSQDSHLANLIANTNSGAIIVANKFDLLEDQGPENIKRFTDYIYRHLPQLDWAPIVFCSTITKRGIKNILSRILAIKKERERMIEEKTLDGFFRIIIKKHPPTAARRGVKHPYIYSLKQINTNPPLFEITVDRKENLHLSYLEYIKNRLREEFGFQGTVIKILLREVEF